MKMKKLLAILTSVALLFGVVSVSLVPSASETVGAITVEDVEIEPTATSFDVDVKIDFTDKENGVIAPHNIVSITCANTSFELTNVELGTVEYKYTGSTTAEDGTTVNLPNGVVTIASDGVKDVNWDEGKILIQAPVDDSAPIVTEINLTATFTLKTDATLTEDTYAITVNGDDMTNVDMETIGVTAGEGTLTVAAPATECEHVWEFVEAIPATSTEAGTITYHCALCDTDDVQDVTYYDEYRPTKFNLNMAAETELNYYVLDSKLELQGAPEDVVFKTVIDMDTNDVIEYTTWADAEDVVFDGVNTQRISTGIASKFMTNPVTINAFVKYNGVWYSGRATSLSVVDAATRLYANISESERKLYADLLDYGGKAQIYFEYREDNLANSAANLGNYASYVTQENPILEDNKVNNRGTQSVRTARFTLDLASKVSVFFTLRLDEANPVPDISSVTATASYTKQSGDVVTNTYSEFDATDDATRYTYYYSELNSRQWNTNFTIKYQVDGVDQSSELTCSVEDLAAYLISTGISEAEANMYYAMIKYGNSAQAHFGS